MSEKKAGVCYESVYCIFYFVSAVIAIFKDAHPEVTFIAQMMGVSLGRSCRIIFGTVLIWIILERRDKSFCICLFYMGGVR